MIIHVKTVLESWPGVLDAAIDRSAHRKPLAHNTLFPGNRFRVVRAMFQD